ncbi:2-C-methyl-D-erythritol 4-phosphate cytidylyltransferase [Marinobacteraceae bacterium S3BR75-40.1]
MTRPNPEPRIWVIVPAAGIGARMGADRPKQYLTLQGRYLLDITLERLLVSPHIGQLHLALHPDDDWWPRSGFADDARVVTYTGGTERADSVRLGLAAVATAAAPEDWVMVHDVARPCIDPTDIDRLVTSLADDVVGGLLAVPMSDTVKRRDAEGRVSETVDRSVLWRAYTPQMFRFETLRRALEEAAETGRTVTDEASAVEALGLAPKLVEGRPDNLKVTVPEDLALVEAILAYNKESS